MTTLVEIESKNSDTNEPLIIYNTASKQGKLHWGRVRSENA